MDAVPAEIVARLVGEHRRFLAFLEPRVGSRSAAEEILQAAFVRGFEKAESLRDGERAVAWFYRLLRNAVVDHYRRRAAETRAIERHAAEALAEEGLEPELERALCQCVDSLLGTLKTEYAELLRAVDLQGLRVEDAARAAGITTNNAGVRLHRARQALRRRLEETCGTCTEHGCLDCSCGGSATR